MGIQANMLPDGKRLHLQHGPIDLIVEADGEAAAVRCAYEAARARFETILDVLAGELKTLRATLTCDSVKVTGPVACRMVEVTAPLWRHKLTPMAAVAGAVADEMLAAMLAAVRPLRRAYVNNGGDIALYLAEGERFSVASANGMVDVKAGSGIAGIATSGWRGRSFSFGIADSVTVLARSAAAADAAATLIANAVDLPGSSKIRRAPAAVLYPDSDLGHRRVTVEVGQLTADEVHEALAHGLRKARNFRKSGLIKAATLGLNGEVVVLDADQPAMRTCADA